MLRGAMARLVRLEERLGDGVSQIGGRSVEKRALALQLVMMAALCAYRVYDLWTTGFIVSDEYGYINYAIQHNANNALYGGRIFFSSLNFFVFQVLGINNITSFTLFLPFYLFFWSGLTVVLFYKIMKSMGFHKNVIAISLLSSLFLIAFDLLSLGFLTEPVGLAMATLGVYFVMKFAKAEPRPLALLAYPILASLSFSAAAYTREPYAAFLVAGVLPVSLAAANHWPRSNRKQIPHNGPNKVAVASVLVLAVLLFEGTSLYALQSSSTSLLAQVTGLEGSLVQTLSNPIAEIVTTSQTSRAPTTVTTSSSTTTTGGTSAQAATVSAIACPSSLTSTASIVTTTTTTTLTSSTSATSTSTIATTTTATTSSTSTTTASTASSTTTTATTSASSVLTTASATTTASTSTNSTSVQTHVQVVVTPRITNTAMIFAVGLFFGWGPILPVLTTIGAAALLITAFRRRSLVNASTLTLSLLALGSYLVVSFIFSDDANYLTYEHLSTLIRFSHTAIPAYFILAPVAFELLLRKRKYILPVIIVMLLTLAALPAYQTYASSNLNLRQNPFSLSYRTPGTAVRDYVAGHPDGDPYIIMGLGESSWWWTPGTAAISNVSFFPYLSYQELASNRWSSFYVFGDGNDQMYCELHAVIPLGVSLGQYQLVREQPVLNQSGYGMVKVDLRWLTS